MADDLSDSLESLEERLQEMGDKLARAAEVFGRQAQGPQTPDWPEQVPGMREEAVPDWPEMTGAASPPLPDWPGSQSLGGEPVPDWPEAPPGVAAPTVPDWPDLANPAQAGRELAQAAPQLAQEGTDGPVRVEGWDEVVGLLQGILAALQGGRQGWDAGSSAPGMQQGAAFAWSNQEPDTGSLEGYGVGAGLGDGFAAASPSVRYSKRAGARGAGGYGYGSAYGQHDMGPTDYAEPERHWRG